MVDYKGYLIFGKALRIHLGWWRLRGSVFTNSPEGYVHIKHLEGVIESKQAAEAHGLELCKKWVDENLESSEEA